MAGRCSICNSTRYRRTGDSAPPALTTAITIRLPTPLEPGSFRCHSSLRDQKDRKCPRSAAAELEGANELRDLRRCICQRVCGGCEVGDASALLLVRHCDVVHCARECTGAEGYACQSLSHDRDELIRITDGLLDATAQIFSFDRTLFHPRQRLSSGARRLENLLDRSHRARSCLAGLRDAVQHLLNERRRSLCGVGGAAGRRRTSLATTAKP